MGQVLSSIFFQDVAVTYNPAQVDHPYLWWYPEYAQINLELFTPKKKLEKGKSLTLDYQFQLLAK